MIHSLDSQQLQAFHRLKSAEHDVLLAYLRKHYESKKEVLVSSSVDQFEKMQGYCMALRELLEAIDNAGTRLRNN